MTNIVSNSPRARVLARATQTQTRPRARARRPAHRRGSVLVVALSICAILTALLMVFTRSIRVESLASANHVASLQCGAIERGAEQYVLALLAEQGSTIMGLEESYFAGVPVGDGYFWVIRPYFGDDDLPLYGLVDEASKININAASPDTLLNLPYMTPEIAYAIKDWRDEDEEPEGDGAENEYYSNLPESYYAKNGPFESVEELLLVRDVTREFLYGEDAYPRRREEGRIAGGLGSTSSRQSMTEDYALAHGMADYLTVFSKDAAAEAQETGTDGSGAPGGGGTAARLNVNSTVEDDWIEIASMFEAEVSESLYDPILTLLRSRNSGGQGGGQGGGGQGGGGQQAAGFRNIWQFYRDAGLDSSQIDVVAGRLTAAPADAAATPQLKVNVLTAPRDVLLALLIPEEIIAQIQQERWNILQSGSTDGGLYDLFGPDVMVESGDNIVAQSDQYSADIVAVTGNGRSFKRMRVVFDISVTPPKIVFRKDLTARGWPLEQEILQALRNGEGPQTFGNGTNRSGTGSGLGGSRALSGGRR